MLETEISKIAGFLSDGLHKYSDLKDFLSDEILENKAIELFGDCSKTVKFFVGTKKLVDMTMFNHFLKGFNIGEDAEEEKLEKLKKYVNNEDKAIFIGKTLESILNSKSKHASFILGYIINTLIVNQKELNPKYIILADALTNMFDHDIENVRFAGDFCNYIIYDNREAQKGTIKKNKRDIYFYKKFKTILAENNIDKDIFYLTLEKCISYQLMRKNVDSSTELNLDGLDISYDKESDYPPEISTGTASADTDVEESYEMTVVGDLLYDIILKLQIK